MLLSLAGLEPAPLECAFNIWSLLSAVQLELHGPGSHAMRPGSSSTFVPQRLRLVLPRTPRVLASESTKLHRMPNRRLFRLLCCRCLCV